MTALSLLRRFARDRSGAALIELAFAVPVLVIILLGCFEATRYVLLHQKLDRAASSTADLVAQQKGITTSQMCDLFDAARQLMKPYDLIANGRVVISSVSRPDTGPPRVSWQELSTGSVAVTSQVGTAGGTATLPPELVLQIGGNVIVAETFYNYEPFFLSALFEPTQLYHTAYHRPRVTNLTTITNSGGC